MSPVENFEIFQFIFTCESNSKIRYKKVYERPRGGVEDTRLEAKAKDTKNLRPRPRTAFLRTDPLEAKNRNARGQG